MNRDPNRVTGDGSDPSPSPTTRRSHAGTVRRLRAITRKEFIQLARDRRTVALMVGMPLVLLLIFGYGIRLSVNNISAELVGQDLPEYRLVALVGAVEHHLGCASRNPCRLQHLRQ